MQNYKAEIAYIGTEYFGYQSQPHKKTIQDHLEHVFGIFFARPTIVTSASRTDSGVHAAHQVVFFRAEKEFNAFVWQRALNELLPNSIGILNIKIAEPDFHPINSSTGKIYCYRLWRGYCGSPFFRPFVWSVAESLSIDLLMDHSRQLIGTHDFKNLCAKNHGKKNTVRSIKNILLREKREMIEIWFAADGFLKQMIRIVVANLIELQTNKKWVGYNGNLLNRIQEGQQMIAPALGLTLEKVCYDFEEKNLEQFIVEKN